MGLGVSVGLRSQLEDDEGRAWFERQLALVNDVLREHGLPPHEEPSSLPDDAESRAMNDSFPYSFIHFLRHAYAWSRQQPGKPLPVVDKLKAAEDRRIETECERLESHLILHSDADGMYVPVEFAAPILDERLSGEMLGSSIELRRELITVAPLLGIEVIDGEVSDEQIELLNELDDDAPHFREKCVFATLWEACRLSIVYGTAIVFH